MSTSDFKPMLAATYDPSKSGSYPPKYPVLVSPKLDGVRVLVLGGRALSRNLIEIPCPTVQELYGDPRFNGLDGELIIGNSTDDDAFRRTMSFVMSHAHLSADVEAQLRFWVFDDFSHGGGFKDRLAAAQRRVGRASKIFESVVHFTAVNEIALLQHEEWALEQGYEGLMIRDRFGYYKHGRSTQREGGLMKLKRFEDAEAVITGVSELQRNENEARTGGLAQRRASHQAGKVGGQTLGALSVRGLNGKFKNVEFEVGSGFSQAERAHLWQAQNGLIGQVIRYRYFPIGSKERPRFPTFSGFRHQADL